MLSFICQTVAKIVNEQSSDEPTSRQFDVHVTPRFAMPSSSQESLAHGCMWAWSG
jgi:hypothetical protein